MPAIPRLEPPNYAALGVLGEAHPVLPRPAPHPTVPRVAHSISGFLMRPQPRHPAGLTQALEHLHRFTLEHG